MIIIVTGVSGSGKSTIGAMLAGRLGWEYAEADDFHSRANLEKMHAGHPLTDEDRWPWLKKIAAWIDEHHDRNAVVTCSALKRSYRDLLRRPETRLVYLDGSQELITQRLVARHGHFFPTALVESQFRDLEPPEPDEHALYVPIDEPATETVKKIIKGLGLSPRGLD
ncbi:MAG TPA: gluconokinase [Streptosporangiaceae bacterium]|nr:gluconokinase [Streptosporangiaceae bacterium]